MECILYVDRSWNGVEDFCQRHVGSRAKYISALVPFYAASILVCFLRTWCCLAVQLALLLSLQHLVAALGRISISLRSTWRDNLNQSSKSPALVHLMKVACF